MMCLIQLERTENGITSNYLPWVTINSIKIHVIQMVRLFVNVNCSYTLKKLPEQRNEPKCSD